ncbi:hypothetical protein Hanom_Chr06g00491721 [Helianthus anomalus]
MYVLALVFVFSMALFGGVSNSMQNKMTKSNNACSGRSGSNVVVCFGGHPGVHGDVGDKSFDVRLFLAAVSRHALGVFLFGVTLKPANNNTELFFFLANIFNLLITGISIRLK